MRLELLRCFGVTYRWPLIISILWLRRTISLLLWVAVTATIPASPLLVCAYWEEDEIGVSAGLTPVEDIEVAADNNLGLTYCSDRWFERP